MITLNELIDNQNKEFSPLRRWLERVRKWLDGDTLINPQDAKIAYSSGCHPRRFADSVENNVSWRRI